MHFDLVWVIIVRFLTTFRGAALIRGRRLLLGGADSGLSVNITVLIRGTALIKRNPVCDF